MLTFLGIWVKILLHLVKDKYVQNGVHREKLVGEKL